MVGAKFHAPIRGPVADPVCVQRVQEGTGEAGRVDFVEPAFHVGGDEGGEVVRGMCVLLPSEVALHCI